MKLPKFDALEEPLIFERSSSGKKAVDLPPLDVPEKEFDKSLLREELPDFPEVSEVEIIRHFSRLSQLNYSVDTGFYPLGSCTMKYSPKINEKISMSESFTKAHPYLPEYMVQGNLEIIKKLEQYLSEITGMDYFSLSPAAGAHGELTGMLIIRAYHNKKKERRTKVLIPDSAHGTNPSSAHIAGFEVEEIPSDSRGTVDTLAFEKIVDENVAALMLTNPNTLGIFEDEILKISEILHSKGAILYMDGANLNALLGISKPGKMGVDVLHLNLHKTFSTPHGGGGPGSGPVGVKKELEEFLPVPLIEKSEKGYYFYYDRPNSIGRVRTFYGNFLVLVKTLAYILSLGPKGLKEVAEIAVLNSNYIRKKLETIYTVPYSTPTLHECVLSHNFNQTKGVRTLDIAKRLIDYGIHPPTIYFPLIVNEALMVEPTETEGKRDLDNFINAMIEIAKEIEENSEILKNAPSKSPVARLDETSAARRPKLVWKKE
ncbi:MAG: aminomethyl-transferring glycine dehydrogenase subunit GcvPB [Acidobacteriota bacterium]